MTRLTIVLILCALFVSGCSGSSESQSPAETVVADNTVTNAVTEDGIVESPDNVVDSSMDSTASDSTINDPVNSDIENDLESSVGTTNPENVAPVSTRVNFAITVPAYQSNALQVRLQWGDKDVSARFVVDESWVIDEDFPVDTENNLIVTFNDDNGAITLGSFEQAFRTGTNASESIQITADQFDTDQ